MKTIVTYPLVRALLQFLVDDEQTVDDQPVQYGLYPLVVFRDRSTANQSAKLIDNPRTSQVYCLNILAFLQIKIRL